MSCLICISLLKMWRDREKCIEKILKWEIRKICLDGTEKDKRKNGAIVMEFALLFQSFLVTSSNLFGLFETMAVVLKWKFFVSSMWVTQWKTGGWRVHSTEEWAAPRKAPPAHCWEPEATVLRPYVSWVTLAGVGTLSCFKPGRTGPDEQGRNGLCHFSLLIITQ